MQFDCCRETWAKWQGSGRAAAHLANRARDQRQCGGVARRGKCARPSKECQQTLLAALLAQVSITLAVVYLLKMC